MVEVHALELLATPPVVKRLKDDVIPSLQIMQIWSVSFMQVWYTLVLMLRLKFVDTKTIFVRVYTHIFIHLFYALKIKDLPGFFNECKDH